MEYPQSLIPCCLTLTHSQQQQQQPLRSLLQMTVSAQSYLGPRATQQSSKSSGNLKLQFHCPVLFPALKIHLMSLHREPWEIPRPQHRAKLHQRFHSHLTIVGVSTIKWDNEIQVRYRKESQFWMSPFWVSKEDVFSRLVMLCVTQLELQTGILYVSLLRNCQLKQKLFRLSKSFKYRGPEPLTRVQ